MDEMAAPKDLYMQFADVSVEFDSSDSSTLVTDKVNTGLSIRGQLIWLIHQIEVLFSTQEGGASNQQRIAISTREGLTSLPNLGDAGVIAKLEKQFLLATSGISLIHQPHTAKYLPPIPIASPAIHLYAETKNDSANFRGELIEARFCFTTAPLDAKTYTEIAETWGW
jgi:hypothetical protein